MPLEVEWRPDIGKKVENFFNAEGYKDYLENAVSFNRKLNEERKMRLPYIDAQTGVAQRHYNSLRNRRERMPGRRPGQIYSYPQKPWRKRKYQYLKYFLQTKHTERDLGDSSICQNENSTLTGMSLSLNEDSNASSGNLKEEVSKSEWSYYDDMFPEGNDDPFNSDSDFEYEDSYTRKKNKSAAGKRGGKAKPGPKPGSVAAKRLRSQLDPSQDVDKPYSCERRSSSRRSTMMPPNYREEPIMPHFAPPREEPPPPKPPVSVPPPAPAAPPAPPPKKPVEKSRAPSLGYCDFCLGDASLNKKTNEPEELVSCAECGRSGHPTCLQFTENMVISVKKYPWQCIECKCCTLCGTSENDDQLLFCDDCDRGYHMYCLIPPIKEPPEGSWSCKLCVETFHT